jgi:hypothetical protein
MSTLSSSRRRERRVRIERVFVRRDGLVIALADGAGGFGRGLLRYAKQQEIMHVTRQRDLAAAARALIELVRLRSGALQDDIPVVLCRSVA